MARITDTYTTLDDWLTSEAIPFSLDAPTAFHAAVDTMIASLDDTVEVLGFGEALHGGEEILLLRNRLFQHLVERHGFSAIAIESSFPLAHVVNDYIAGRGPASYEEVQATGFSPVFGQLEANRELVEWMRERNIDPAQRIKLQFYGFDIPSGTVGIGSPRHVLSLVCEYLASIDRASGQKHSERITALLGDDFDWENPAAMMDPTTSIGLSPAATALRIETEELISQLRARRSELIAQSDEARYVEALHYASMARQLLNFHAAMARPVDYAERLGIRDVLMADNLQYIASRERGRGKVLVFAHNSHVKRGMAHWQIGADVHRWWPVGAQLDSILGSCYAVIGSAVGVSGENGIAQPEAGTLEARFVPTPGPMRLIPTHRGRGLPAADIAALPTLSGSVKNPTYFPLTPQCFTEFDVLAVLDSTTYQRGGPPLNEWDTNLEQ